MKRLITSFIILLLSVSAFAQESVEAQKGFLDDPFGHPMTPLYLLSALIIVVALLIALVGVYMIRILNMVAIQSEKERAQKQGVPYVPQPTWWSRFSQSLNASVPLEKEKDIELDHNFDGIKELDNHLPPWWTWLFYGTIAWSVVYIFVFHVSNTLPLQSDEYQSELLQAEEQTRKLRASRPVSEVDENSLTFTLDSINLISNGKAVFTANNCGSCHRADGGGNAIGPNLTDEYWLHGGHIKNVFMTVKDGVVDKGMPAWGKALSPQQVRDVTFYILSLQGTNPENAKKAQGEIYKVVTVEGDTTRAQASL